MGEPLYQDNTGPGDLSQAEHASRQESIEMRIILLLTVFATLGLCQSPPSTPLTEPPQGQRCAGRNFNGRRCCTPESPCGYGEGDCDGPLDGGANDGHRGCQGDLVCGSNNCKKFGTYFHEKDDCCDLPETLAIPEPLPLIPAGVPLEPPAGQRCAGRNYNGKRCCTPENPCDEGEGDCDGPGDGGNNDGHRGCKGDLICGSNNCLQFGAYYHPKDDCCERPKGVSLAGDPGVTGHPVVRCISRSVEGAGRSGPENVWVSSAAPASSTQRTFRSNTAESLTVTQSSLTSRTLGVSSDFLIMGLIDEFFSKNLNVIVSISQINTTI